MGTIHVKRVETKREMDDFVQFTNDLYEGCPYYVPDLDMDIRETFDPKKNAGLEFSDIQPFIAYDDSGKAIASTLPRKEKYTLAVSAFTFSGGNGRFQTMRKLMEKRDYKLNGLLRDCVRNFLTQ